MSAASSSDRDPTKKDTKKDLAPIVRFQGCYSFLSNFYLHPLRIVTLVDQAMELEAVDYPSAEHAFQAAKTLDADERRAIREAALPSQAKRLGRRATLRADWERIKIAVMLSVLRAKFADETLRARLVETAGRDLVEGNSWGDVQWGKVDRQGVWVGENLLGKCLMTVRDELVAKAAEAAKTMS